MITTDKKDITERVDSFESACKELGIKMGFVFKIITTCAILNKDVKAYLAFVKLTIIIRALNEGWEPNWENYSEWKYYAWFKVSGSRLAYYDCVRTYSGTYVGSRLVFKESRLAEYAGKKFLPLYEDYLLIKKAA
jgi:hypothetical protein